MRLLLLGSCGQLGRALTVALPFVLPSWVVITPRRDECNFDDPIGLLEFIDRTKPGVIVNAAAYTSVEQAEVNHDLVYRVNTHAVAILAGAAERIGALLVHFSTDYVFDGTGDSFWREEDNPSPLNIYGVSKWKGEQAILASGCHYLIFRTSWVHSPYRHNFLKTMLYLGKESESLAVVCDQIGSPTSATMLAEVVLEAIHKTLVNPALCGLYHVAAMGETSWYDYARFIFIEAKKLGADFKICELRPVPSHAYFCVAKRPLNSRLDTTKLRATFRLTLPHWHDGVEGTLRQLLR